MKTRNPRGHWLDGNKAQNKKKHETCKGIRLNDVVPLDFHFMKKKTKARLSIVQILILLLFVKKERITITHTHTHFSSHIQQIIFSLFLSQHKYTILSLNKLLSECMSVPTQISFSPFVTHFQVSTKFSVL